MNSTMSMDAQFLQNLGVIAQSEEKFRRLVKYVKRLAEPKADPTLISRDEFFANINEAEQQIARGEGRTFTDLQSMNAWLNAL